MSSVPERGEIDEQYKWDLTDLYADEDEWEAAYEAVEERLDDLREYEGRVTESAATLQEVLQLREDLLRKVSNVAAYARLRRDEDTTDQHCQALAARAQSLSAEASSAASFVEPELQQADRETIESFVDAAPALEIYEHYFDDVLRMKPHTRSPEIEEVLADLSEVTGAAGEVYNMLTNADMAFPTVEDPSGETRQITLNNFTTLQKHQDREFRREVYETFYDEWETVRNAVSTAYKNAVKTDVKLAGIRDYETAREASLDGANVPVSVYDTLLETVDDNLDLLHRHADLKADRLGVDDLAMWDLYRPMAGGDAPSIEYEQAAEWVVEALAPLGESYQDRVAEGLESRWVDVYETAGKQSGAYSGGTYDSQPYVLMNYQDDITSMFTLAHELGHSMHSDLASDAQPYVYSSYEIFVAEVASTVNETLLTHHLLDVVEDDDLRRHVLDEYLERFRSTLFRQTMFADFEHRAHAHAEDGGAITADWLDEQYHDLKTTYYAPASVDDRIAREWMRIPHFYYGFYVYQYATGIASAVSIATRIEESDRAADDYLDALQQGGSAYPVEILDTAGVDVTATTYLSDALDEYGRLLDQFAALD
ncbi:MAG: oligoendopeptidase F [Haloarculaceae archaeon]